MCPLCRSIWRHSQCVLTHTLHVSPRVCVYFCVSTSLFALKSYMVPGGPLKPLSHIKGVVSVHSRVCRETHYRYHAIAHALNNINQRLPGLTQR